MSEYENLLDRLERVSERFEELRTALAPYRNEEIEELAEHLRELDRILDTYETRATESGDFGGYVAFRSTIDQFVDGLPGGLPEREKFEAMGERVDKRRLSTRDFDEARALVNPARELVETYENWQSATKELRNRRTEVRKAIADIEETIDEHDRMLGLRELDLDAPIKDIREPIQTYNEAVTEAFESHLRETTAADVLELFEHTKRYPLVDAPRPPDELYRYVTEATPELTVHDLLEYADFSISKLTHYVDDPSAFRAAVATELTYLNRLNATPFRIDWPPLPAEQLRWRLRELRPVVNRFADDAVIDHLRRVESLTRDEERFDWLREIAMARESISEEDRKRLESGEIERRRSRLESSRDRLHAALAETPNPSP